MSNTAELCARLLEHAAIHDRETSPYSPEQAAWAADLRDAAALIQAAPVVERADSATGVVECGSLNVSNNAQPAASGEPVAWIEGPHGEIRRNLLWKLDPMPPQSVAWSIPLYTMSPKATSGTCTPQPAPTSRLKWMEAPRRSEWGAGMMEALIALGVDETLRLYAHRDAVPMVDALLSAQPAPARVPPAEDPWHKLYRRAINEANGLTNYVEDRPELRSAERRLTAIEAEARALAATATPAQGEPK